MTFFHILNFALPIVALLALGIILDKISAPYTNQKSRQK